MYVAEAYCHVDKQKEVLNYIRMNFNLYQAL